MKIRCLIIEDDLFTAENISGVIQSWFQNIEIVGLAHTLSEAENLIQLHRPTLVISDINLGDEVVFSLFKKIVSIDFKLIFITAYNKYAVEAFKFSALDFLEKPFDDQALIAAVEKAVKSLNADQYNEQLQVFFHNFNPKEKQKKLVLKNLEAVHIVNVEAILFIKSDNNYSEFHIDDSRKIIVSKPLKLYDDQLKHHSFFRSHQSYLVNLKYAKTFHKQDSTLELTNGQHIAVSGVKVQALLHKIGTLS